MVMSGLSKDILGLGLGVNGITQGLCVESDG